MTPLLLASLIALAALDSLNPFLFVALLFLLTTPDPLPRSVAYILGILVLNLTAGFLLYGGIRTLIIELLGRIDELILVLAQIALGIALIIYGILAKTEGPTEEARQPISLRPIHSFLLGMAVMLNEVTTALPYFAAVERLVAARIGIGQVVLGLLVYNAVFALPLVGFVTAALLLRDRFQARIEALSQRVQRLTRVLLKWGSLIFGIILVIAALL
ncbi:MAG: hypothetical protein GYB64_15365 [Chloroflexi bacterium]|nr:hypothetical protein [Chloroflexota bacterium]